jgi:hypothetical protein
MRKSLAKGDREMVTRLRSELIAPPRAAVSKSRARVKRAPRWGRYLSL